MGFMDSFRFHDVHDVAADVAADDDEDDDE